MMKWRHSVAFKLFAVTFAVIMLLIGGMLAVLAGSFASFYERRQAHDITEDLNRLRDRYVREHQPNQKDAIMPYFYDFEKDYYALTSILTTDRNRVRFVIGGGLNVTLTNLDRMPSLPTLPGLPTRLPLTGSKPATAEQMDKLLAAVMEWRSDQAAVDQVMAGGETLVFRAKGYGPVDSGATQLIAIARIEGVDASRGKMLIAVSSLQPISSAASVIRDFSYYVFGAALLLVLVLAYLYAGIITKPLRSLNVSAHKLARLDLTARGRLDRKDEIGELGRSLDFLADNLQETLAELHDANDRLKEDIEREKRLERMRREFIAGVSHELKTPLSLIGGYAEGLRDNIGSGAKRERYAEVIMNETKHMSAIVADMLDLSHLESGQYKLDWQRFDLAELLRESAERADSLGGDRDIHAVVRLPDDRAEEWAVYGDRMRIGQVLTNLLSNAVRHSLAGRVVEVSARAAGDEVEIAVKNEGDPIPEEELPRIWGQFYRIDKSRSREAGGTGIGLAIVRQILQLHGSRYEVESSADGVAFRFTLRESPQAQRQEAGD